MSARPKLPLIARILLGLSFAVFGLNFFLHFLPQPPPPPDALAFVGALMGGKIFAIIKPIEIIAGIALIAGWFVPLALAVLAPIEIGILAFHAVYAPSGLALIIVLMALTIYLAWAYRAAFAPMLRAHAEPRAAEPAAARRTATA